MIVPTFLAICMNSPIELRCYLKPWTFFRSVCLFIFLFSMPKPGFSTTPTQEQWNQALRSAIEILARQYSVFSTIGFEAYQGLTNTQILEKLANHPSYDASFLFPLGKISEIRVETPPQSEQQGQGDAFRRVQWMVSFNIHASSLNIGKSRVMVAVFHPDDHLTYSGMVTNNQWLPRQPEEKNSSAQMLLSVQNTITKSMNSRHPSSQTSRDLDQLIETAKLQAIDSFLQLKKSGGPLAKFSTPDLQKELGFVGEPYLFWKTTENQLGSGLLSESQLHLNELNGVELFIVLAFQKKRYRFSVRFERQGEKLIPSTENSTIFYPDTLSVVYNVFGNRYTIENRKNVTGGMCAIIFKAK